LINPLPDEQLNLLGIVPKQVGHLSLLSILCLGCKNDQWRAARRLIVLHPKQNIESELKWQTCQMLGVKMHQSASSKNAVRQVKG